MTAPVSATGSSTEVEEFGKNLPSPFDVIEIVPFYYIRHAPPAQANSPVRFVRSSVSMTFVKSMS